MKRLFTPLVLLFVSTISFGQAFQIGVGSGIPVNKGDAYSGGLSSNIGVRFVDEVTSPVRAEIGLTYNRMVLLRSDVLDSKEEDANINNVYLSAGALFRVNANPETWRHGIVGNIGLRYGDENPGYNSDMVLGIGYALEWRRLYIRSEYKQDLMSLIDNVSPFGSLWANVGFVLGKIE